MCVSTEGTVIDEALSWAASAALSFDELRKFLFKTFLLLRPFAYITACYLFIRIFPL